MLFQVHLCDACAAVVWPRLADPGGDDAVLFIAIARQLAKCDECAILCSALRNAAMLTSKGPPSWRAKSV
jgi:hypothetical protein